MDSRNILKKGADAFVQSLVPFSYSQYRDSVLCKQAFLNAILCYLISVGMIPMVVSIDLDHQVTFGEKQISAEPLDTVAGEPRPAFLRFDDDSASSQTVSNGNLSGTKPPLFAIARSRAKVASSNTAKRFSALSANPYLGGMSSSKRIVDSFNFLRPNYLSTYSRTSSRLWSAKDNATDGARTRSAPPQPSRISFSEQLNPFTTGVVLSFPFPRTYPRAEYSSTNRQLRRACRELPLAPFTFNFDRPSPLKIAMSHACILSDTGKANRILGG